MIANVGKKKVADKSWLKDENLKKTYRFHQIFHDFVDVYHVP
jgi:hypothetical protein